MYDNEDNVCGVIYNDSPFSFLKNLQGDVITIIDKTGKTVAGYSYDAWGVCTIQSDTSGCNIAMINPYRYRSYYYDTEIGMYYLQSRYYDPSVGRFVNGDAIECIGIENKNLATNLYAYCKNNCLNISDEFGYGAIESLVNALGSATSVLENILNMIKNSYYKERKALESSVKLLTKKQRNHLADIRALNKQVNQICKWLKWFGYALLFVSLATILGTAYRTGKSMDRAIIDCAVEAMINFIIQGASSLFNKIAKYIPYIGFLVSVIGGWLLQYALGRLFNSKKITRIKNRFANSIKNIRTSLWNWIKYGMKSLTA